MADELDALDAWLAPLLQRFSPAQRRQLARRLAQGLRQRQAERIRQQQNPDGSPFEPRKPRAARKAGRIRARAAMFEKLRGARHLLARSDDSGAAVGFSGGTARIARVHQDGLQEALGKHGPLYRYPARRLLGWTAEDRAWVMEQVAAALAE